MWLERLINRIQSFSGPVVIEGGEAYGTPFLIDTLRQRQKVAWPSVDVADARDGIALGNALSQAVNEVLGATLLPYALPFTFNVELLKSQLPGLRPFTLVCSHAERNPLFQAALLALHSEHLKIILDVETTTTLPENALYLSRAELRLTPAEARVLAGVLSEEQVATLYKVSEGGYYSFVTALCRMTGDAPPLLPTPGGLLVPPEDARLVSPEALLDTLLHLGRYVEALDLAVMRVPGRVAEVLKDAGPVYQDRGLVGRLYLLLQSLEPRYQETEEVLVWLLVAATNRGEQQKLIPKVEQFLARHEASELRTRYAGLVPNPAVQLREAQRAASGGKTPLNLWQLGRLHPDPEQSVEILTESVRLAEAYGRPYEIARNAGALAQRLLHAGHFKKASIWAEWALRVFDQHQLKDGDRRLRLLNIWAYSRLVIGEAVGLDAILRDAQQALASTELGLTRLFRSTLAELELTRGNLVEAERLAADNLSTSPRLALGTHAVTAVRVLLEKGDFERASVEAQRSYELTANEAEEYALPAALALGMAQSVLEPKRARPHLVRVLSAPNVKSEYRVAAGLHLLVPNSGNHAVLGDAERRLLKTVPYAGLKLLSGPERIFQSVWQELAGVKLPLRINVLASASVTLNANTLELSPRSLEILTLLALHPSGLTLEALHAALYETADTSLGGLKVAVTKLRKLVPIGTQPYRLTTPYFLDAGACEHYLDEGQLRLALELYRGPLLPTSNAPGIAEARRFLEERLRQAALYSGDAEVLYALAQRLHTDPELWEASLGALVKGDPRVPLARAQLETLL